jgi:transcriptional regulator with XRE-family HTH domain
MPERRILTARKAPRTATGRLCREMRVGLGAEIRRMRVDAGLSQRRLAEMAGIDHAFLSLIERGLREPSLAVLLAVATALGGTVSVRLYPGTGPRLTDPIQARITEAFVRVLDPRWTRMVEVPVHRPARGVIDIVVHDQSSGIVVATEIQSELRRLEQQIRWSHEKAGSLPSSEFWRFLERQPRIDQVLVLRSTRANRELAKRFSETLAVAFPADPVEAYEALTTPDAAWPGSAILWATVEGDVARILERPPRSVVAGTLVRRSRPDVSRSPDGRS